MPHQQSQIVHIGRAGWFAVGALAASTAFLLLLVAGTYFGASGSEPAAQADEPALVIEGN